MLKHEILIKKGFNLNEYPEGKYYELVETQQEKVENILKAAKFDYDPACVDEKVILQLKDDFSNKLICIECNTWDLSDFEFEEILNAIE